MYSTLHPIPERVREMAAQIDPSRTYVFLFMNPGARRDFIKRRELRVQLFARRAGRWRGSIQYFKSGDRVETKDYATPWRIGEIRLTDDDLSVTFINDDGATLTRSANADLGDPARGFLRDMTTNIGIPWEEAIFPK